MKIFKRSVVLSLALMGCASAHSGETPVSVSAAIHGAWVTPDGAWDGRAVLLLHGMASDLNDAGDILKTLAGRLAQEGIASLRFTFRGEGRDNTVLTSTFPSRLEDVAAAQAWLRGQAGVAPGRVGVLGFSLGAPTAIETAARQPEWFKSMVLWSAPSGDLFARWAQDEAAQRALRDGEHTVEIPGWKKLTTRREFYESFRGFDTDVALAKYPGAFLTIRGSGDYVEHRDEAMLQILAARPASVRPVEAVMIGGADHIFNVFQPDVGHASRVIEVTVAWYARTL